MARKVKKDSPKVLATYEIKTSVGVQTVTHVEFVPYKWTAAESAELYEKKHGTPMFPDSFISDQL